MKQLFITLCFVFFSLFVVGEIFPTEVQRDCTVSVDVHLDLCQMIMVVENHERLMLCAAAYLKSEEYRDIFVTHIGKLIIVPQI